MAEQSLEPNPLNTSPQKYSLLREFVYFIRHEKKWWLGFIMLILVMLSIFIYVTEGSAVMPFIYTIF